MSQFINNPEHTFGFDTLQLHVGQESADPASDARAVPIYQTTSYVFRNSQHAADRFGLADAGNIYGRLTNSTQGVFEDRIAALEGGVAGLAVASGAAAITYTLQALAQAGDHVVAQKTIYGGSYNLLEHTLSQFGVAQPRRGRKRHQRQHHCHLPGNARQPELRHSQRRCHFRNRQEARPARRGRQHLRHAVPLPPA